MKSWISGVIGKMHIHKITQQQLADKVGIRRDYLNKILNGHKCPANAKDRITLAVDELVKERKG